MDTIKIQKGGVRMVAHRGLSDIERENTCAAFVAAGNRSYFGIETDIHRTADGAFAVLHDDTLARVAGENVPVEEVTLATLRSIVLLDKEGGKSRTDLRVPTLQEYVSICKTYDKQCVLEMKSIFTEEEMERIVAILREMEYLDRVIFISFHYENLALVRRLLPEQPVQFLLKELTEEWIERLISEGMDVDVRHKGLTAEQVERFHAAGRLVNCWTVNTPEDAERVLALGVDFITTNILE